MKRFFVLIISCLLLYACKPGIPREIIQPDKMEKVLFDVHVVDGYITTITSKDTATRVASSYYKGIYKKFDIDSAMYATSMTYYYSHPEVLDKIYDNVTKLFTEEKRKNDKVVEEESRRAQNKLLAKGKKYLSLDEYPVIPVNFAVNSNPFNVYSFNL